MLGLSLQFHYLCPNGPKLYSIKVPLRVTVYLYQNTYFVTHIIDVLGVRRAQVADTILRCQKRASLGLGAFDLLPTEC